jgi:hypothetical protein
MENQASSMITGISVVTDYDHCPFKGLQSKRECLTHVQIQVVGGLIE